MRVEAFGQPIVCGGACRRSSLHSVDVKGNIFHRTAWMAVPDLDACPEVSFFLNLSSSAFAMFVLRSLYLESWQQINT